MENQKLPNTTIVLLLGLFSIITCWVMGIVGLIFGIVALVIAKGDLFSDGKTGLVESRLFFGQTINARVSFASWC